MEPDFAKRYAELYARHWWFRVREEMILEILRGRQPPEGWRNILDIGCGDGLFFARLAELGEVEGVEPDATVISSTNPHRHRIHVAPFDQDFRPGRSYSLVLMLDVLEHLREPLAALRRAVNLLVPGGTLLVTVPAFNFLWTNHDVINHHVARYTKTSFRALARQAGLEIEKEQYFFYWTCPLKLGLRIVERLFHLQPAPPSLPPRWINQALYWFSRLEQKTLGALPVPFGSSLLVLGRRPAT